MSGMGLAEELALTDETMALIIRAQNELQTSKGFFLFFSISVLSAALREKNKKNKTIKE